jgi:hypothetical protein
MKRELKGAPADAMLQVRAAIARPIPMKRELKDKDGNQDRKATVAESQGPSRGLFSFSTQYFTTLRSTHLPWAIFLCPNSKLE